MNEKITFHQLAEELSGLTGGTQATSELFIKEFFAAITEALKNDGNVKIKNFGTFMLSDVDDVPVVKFVPDKEIAEAINMPFSCFEAVELNDDVTDDMLESVDSDNVPEEHRQEDTETADMEVETEPDSQDETGNDDEQSDVDITACEDDNIAPDETDNNATVEDGNRDEEKLSEDIVTTASVDETPVLEEESVDEDYPNQSNRKAVWIAAVICLLAGLVAGYSLYPVLNDRHYTDISTITEQAVDSVATPDECTVEKDTVADEIEDDSIIEHTVTYDTISKNRFLTTMSREYFGRMEFWVYIYEENKENLGNPNRIKPGTVIKIPSAEKYGIDKDNPECIAAAELKAVEIYAPYQK